mmetsp:Transcript_109359/g.223419  ORF Transcript_109359/g.223419 Transcript_109359/m.223419 type:complete len:448 (+) Transcript_109359:225-1568(+)
MLGLLVAHPISIPKASPITQSHETKQFVPFRFVPSVVKVWIRVVGILVIDIVVVAVHGRLPGALVLPRVDPAVGAGLRLRPAASATVPPLDARPGGRLGVVARGRPHDGPSEPTDPVVLLALRVGVQEVGDLPGGDLEGVALPALEVGRLDRVADGQVDHPVGRRVLVGAVKELAALEQKVPAAPVLEPHRLLRQESLVFDVVRVVDNVRVGIDVGRTGHLRTGLAGLLLLLLLRLGWLRRRPCRLLHLWLLLHSRLLLHRGLLEPWLLLLLHLGLLVVVLLLLLLLRNRGSGRRRRRRGRIDQALVSVDRGTDHPPTGGVRCFSVGGSLSLSDLQQLFLRFLFQVFPATCFSLPVEPIQAGGEESSCGRRGKRSVVGFVVVVVVAAAALLFLAGASLHELVSEPLVQALRDLPALDVGVRVQVDRRAGFPPGIVLGDPLHGGHQDL